MRDCEPGLDFEVARGGIVNELRPELEADRVGTMAAPANSRPVAGRVAGS